MKLGLKITGAVFFALALSVTAVYTAEPRQNFYRGVNLPQAGFGGQHIPGVAGRDYLWPTGSDVNLFADMGANVLRIPFLWERMQPQLDMPLAQHELAQLDALVAAAAMRHVTILLDVHNYGLYRKLMIGSDAVPVTAFTDLWMRLATHYKDQPFVAFGLMNEPYQHKAEEWAAIAQQAIIAIRKTGANQLILVPGTRYSGAYSWMFKDGVLSNAEALVSLTDPADHFIFEVHQYFDTDSSGMHQLCVHEDIGVQRLAAVTAWLRQTGRKGFLGEFGASKDAVCLAALKRTLRYMADNKDVWYGWSYWAAAAWFGDYMFNIYPPDPEHFPQVGILKDAMRGSGH
jgi:endoglucanase